MSYRDYLDTGRFDALAIRRANIAAPIAPQPVVIVTVEEANHAAAKQLLSAERTYWELFYLRAVSDDDMEKAVSMLKELDELEARRGR